MNYISIPKKLIGKINPKFKSTKFETSMKL